MPTLLQINTSLNRGSTGKISEQIGLQAIDNGWDSYIIHGPRYKNPSKLKSIQSVSLYQETIHVLQSLLFDRHGLGSYRSTKKLLETIDEIKPDVVHLHNIHGYYINYKLLFQYLAKREIPIVWTLHDCWAFTGHCAHFDSINCKKWMKCCHSCPSIQKYPKSLIFDRSRRNFLLKKELYQSLKKLTVIPVSDWLSGLVSSSILKEFPRITIHNGIDLEIFKYRKSNLRHKFHLEDQCVLLGVASAWSDSKGLQEFTKLSQVPGYTVILIGVQQKLKSHLPSNMIAIERTDNQISLAEYYSLADVYVNPTYNDTFPTVNLEALACGTPVVTYRTGGSPEAIEGDTGYVVDKGNFEMLLSTIEHVRKQGKSHFMANCRLLAEKKYNMYTQYNEYIKLYNDIITNQ